MPKGEHDWITVGFTEPDRNGVININYRCSKCGQTQNNVPPTSFPPLGGCPR